MSLDRHLIDTIKQHFARKSSAQLQVIAQANDPDRWSVEAISAAREVLLAREEGQAQEPLVPEVEPPPPPSSERAMDRVALGVGLNLLTFPLGFMVIPINRRLEEDTVAMDQPVPFGPNVAWLALGTRDTAAVAAALGLQGIREATWVEGVESAHQSSVFVTPPLADWTLVVGAALFAPDHVEAFVKPLLERLSRQFVDVQYFCTNRVVELHVWARAQQGKLVRGYGWQGNKGVSLWDEGELTNEEGDLGFQYVDGRAPTGAMPDENSVMQLACVWSIDPTSLSEQYKEPSMGMLGNAAWAESGTGR
jgi:hypothetical protein